jgi:hypothetical protein
MEVSGQPHASSALSREDSLTTAGCQIRAQHITELLGLPIMQVDWVFYARRWGGEFFMHESRDTALSQGLQNSSASNQKDVSVFPSF